MWLLIIATTFYAHGEGISQEPTMYQFQEFKTESRCEAVKKWVIKRESVRIAKGRTTVECVKND